MSSLSPSGYIHPPAIKLPISWTLTWTSTRKSRNGTSGSTQATILAMRALLEGGTSSLGQEFESTITLTANGKPIKSFKVNKHNSDVMQQFDLSEFLRPGDNRIDLHQEPA